MREVASGEGVAKLCETGNSCSALNLSALLTPVAFQTRSSSSVADDSVDSRTMFNPLASTTTYVLGWYIRGRWGDDEVLSDTENRQHFKHSSIIMNILN